MLTSSRIFFNFYKYKRKTHSSSKLLYCCKNTFDKLKILFFGTDNFSLPSLTALNKESKRTGKISSIGIVTSFKSTTNPVRKYAEEQNLLLYKWPIEVDTVKGYDLGVVVSFGHLIPEKLISAFPLGMINVHASILPRWRGAAPIIYALMHGDKTTGVTIMKIEPKHFDIGDILGQKEIDIKPDIVLPELHDILANEGAELMLKTVRDIPKSLESSKKQDQTLVTYAPKISPSIAELRWTEMTAQNVHNLHRALYSYRELRTKFQEYIVKIVELRVNNSTEKSIDVPSPGYVEYCKNNKCLKVYCQGGSCVEIAKVKVEGKRIMSANDFNNGFLKKFPKEERYFK